MNSEEIKNEIEQMCESVGFIVPSDDNAELSLQEEMDSLQFISLICDLEERYNIEFVDEELIPDSYKNYESFINIILNKIEDGDKVNETQKKMEDK